MGLFRSSSGQLRWFHLQVQAGQLPFAWGCPGRLQEAICALELLAKLALVLARAKVDNGLFAHAVCLRQFGDNLAVVASCNKGLSTSGTMSFALMTLASACLDLGVALDMSHIAGDRNVEADGLSRLNHRDHQVPSSELKEKFNADSRVPLTLDEILAPWRKFIGRPRLP